MKKIHLFAAAFFITVVGCSPKVTSNLTSKKETETSGSIKLANGQKYLVVNKLSTNSSSEMQGQTMESKADINSTYKIQVNDLQGNNYSMTNSMSAIKMNMNAMGQNINFDSDKKEDMDGQMGSNVKNFINKDYPVVMDYNGNIILPAKTDTAKATSAATQTEMIMKQMGDPAEQGYGAKLAFVAVPKNAKAGTTWVDSTSKEGVKRVTNYTIKSVNGSIATISTSGTETRDTKMEMQGMEISTKTAGSFTGEEMANLTTGVISQNSTTAEAKGTISVMGQEIPTNIKATSVTTVTPM